MYQPKHKHKFVFVKNSLSKTVKLQILSFIYIVLLCKFCRVFKNDMDNSLTISGTISLDTGKYTCIAENGLDDEEASAQLIVQGQWKFPFV